MPEKIVIVKLAAIGDVVLAQCALRQFCEQNSVPLELHWILDEKLLPLAKHLSTGLDCHWYSVDSKKLFGGSLKEKLVESLKIFNTVRKISPDKVVLLHRDFRYKILLRAAFSGELLSISREKKHEYDVYFDIFAKLSVTSPSRRTTQTAPTIEHVASRRTPKKIGFLVGGAKNQKTIFLEKRWPNEHLSSLLRQILAHADTEVFLFGSPDDEQDATAVLKALMHHDRIKNFVGKLALPEVAHALSELDVFVSIDSGLAHLAASVMKKADQRVITLFGPTDPHIWAPRTTADAQTVLVHKNKPCAPCYRDNGEFKACLFTEERFQHCMKDISPNEIHSIIFSST